MPAQTLTLGGKRFVIVPESEYRKLTGKISASGPEASVKAKNSRHRKSTASRGARARKQDLGDLAEHKRRMSEPGGTPLEQVRERLGL